VFRDIDPEFLHHGYGFSADFAGFSPGTADLKSIARIVTQQTLSHLASSGVAGAENEHPLLICHDV